MTTRFILFISLAFLLITARVAQAYPLKQIENGAQTDGIPSTILLIAVLLITAALLRLVHPSRKKHLR